VKDPILKPLDPTKNLIISTDGSVYGMGWATMQENHGNLHAVSYGEGWKNHDFLKKSKNQILLI